MSIDVKKAFDRLVEAKGTTSRINVGTISAHDYQRFAYAVGHLDERYLLGGTELTTAGDAAEAPPLFLSAVMEWTRGPAEAELRTDGSQPASTSGLPLEGLRIMGAGQELEFHVALVDGLTVEMILSIEDVVYKEGKSGGLIVLRIRREYVDDAGSPVLTCIETVIAR